MATAKRPEASEEDDIASANDAAVEKLQARAKAKSAAAEPDHDVDVDEEDDDEPSRPIASEEQRESRQDRRRARKSQFEEAQRERDEYRRQAEQHSRELAELRGRTEVLLSQRQGPAEQPQKLPEEVELHRKERELRDVWAEFSRLPIDEQNAKLPEWQDKYIAAEREVRVATNRWDEARNGKKVPPQLTPAQVYMQANCGDILSHPKGVQALMGAVQTLLAEDHEDSLETLAKAADIARRTIRLQPKNVPPITRREPGLKAKLRAGGQTPQGGGGGQPERRIIKMGGGSAQMKARRTMAKAAFPHLSEDKAMEKWAKGPGKRMMEKGLIDE
jgi:hypothetical protein